MTNAERSYAPEWTHNYVLTWSGRWHIADVHHSPDSAHSRRALCGATGYTRDGVPTYVRRLLDIASGVKAAPTCKKCDRANRMTHRSVI